MYSIQADDGTYMMIRIYNAQFSCNIDIQVGQAFLEMCVPSGYYLKDQQEEDRVNNLPYMQVPKEIIVSSHKQELLQLWIGY